MPKFHNIEQGSPEWHEFRRTRIMASEIGIIMGLSGWMTPFQLYQQKLGLVPPVEPTGWILRGKSLEEPARLRYIEISGVNVAPAVVTHSENDLFAASLDGVDFLHTRICEIKCPGTPSVDEAKEGIVKPLYMAQMQWQMYCMGLKECDYFTYCGKTYETILDVVTIDPEFIEQAVLSANKFLECLRKRIPPELTAFDYEDRSKDSEWEGLAQAYAYYDELEKKAKKEKDFIRKQMIDASRGNNVLGSNSRFTKYSSQGLVQYKNIPELQGVDLEKYRGPSTEAFRITISKGD